MQLIELAPGFLIPLRVAEQDRHRVVAPVAERLRRHSRPRARHTLYTLDRFFSYSVNVARRLHSCWNRSSESRPGSVTWLAATPRRCNPCANRGKAPAGLEVHHTGSVVGHRAHHSRAWSTTRAFFALRFSVVGNLREKCFVCHFVSSVLKKLFPLSK